MTDGGAAEIDRHYPRPILDEGYERNIAFFDPDPATGQTYPGFPVKPPAPPEEA